MITIQHPSGKLFVRDPEIIPDHAYSIEQVFMMLHAAGSSIRQVSIGCHDRAHVMVCDTVDICRLVCPGWHWVTECGATHVIGGPHAVDEVHRSRGM